jgi:sulfate permease, SulP family
MPKRAEKPNHLVEPTTAMLRLDLLRTYQWSWLLNDLTAGMVIFAATIPAALAYGQLAGLNPVNGLYASLLAMSLYALFGTSRQLIIDADAAVAILVFTSVAGVMSGGDPARFAALAFLEAIMVGVMHVMAGLFRAGFVSDFIPKSVVTGFINGIALIIILTQAGSLFGITLKSQDFFPRILELINRAQEFHLPTLYLGGACLLGMLILRPFLRWVPEGVLVVVLATLAVMRWNLQTKGILLVGLIPQGLPHPSLPAVGFSDILTMFPVALGVALVSFVDTTITGRAFAFKGGYRLDPNQELIALGLANIGCGLCHGFTVGSSHSRTAINDMVGGRSQFAGLLAVGLLGIFMLYFTSILKDVPTVALSAFIIVAALRLLRPVEVFRIFQTRPASGYFSIITTLAILISGLMTGILVSVAIAIILVLHSLARPHETIIRTPKVPGLLIYRFAGPLFFFNAAYFANRVQEVIDSAKEPVKHFLINAEAIVDMDYNAAEILEDLQSSLKRQGINMCMCDVKGYFRKVLMTTHLPGRVGFNIFPSVAVAVPALSKEKAEAAKKAEN